jgi:hypothetical protein
VWQFVGVALKSGVSDTHHDLAVTQAADTAQDSDLASYIIPYSSEEELKSVLPQLVTRGQWMSIGEVLKNVELRSHVLEQVAVSTNPNHVIPVLPNCSDSELDAVLTRRMSKGLWLDVYFGLNEDNTHFKNML